LGKKGGKEYEAFIIGYCLLYLYGGFAAIQGTKAIVSERLSIIERPVE